MLLLAAKEDVAGKFCALDGCLLFQMGEEGTDEDGRDEDSASNLEVVVPLLRVEFCLEDDIRLIAPCSASPCCRMALRSFRAAAGALTAPMAATEFCSDMVQSQDKK